MRTFHDRTSCFRLRKGCDKQEDSNSVSNFRNSEPLKNALKAKGLRLCFQFKLGLLIRSLMVWI
uniref:Uncharacterized protein n=1 Tax=Helianthus annuus TaxID=4232 RepID=A0A251UQ09_HELAN